MSLYDVLNTIEHLDRIHCSPDESIAWAYVSNTPIRFRYTMLPIEHWGFYPDKLIKDKDELIHLAAAYDPIVIWYRSLEDSHNLAVILRGTVDMVIDFTPTGFELIGYTAMNTSADELRPIDFYNQWSAVTIPYTYAAGGVSILPILWRVDPADRKNTYVPMTQFEDILFNEDVFKKFASEIKNALPPIEDVQAHPEQRYAILELEDGAQFMYNRNHIAYNGTVPAYHEFGSMVFYMMAQQADAIHYENLSEYFCNMIDAGDIMIQGKSAETPTPDSTPTVEESMNPPTRESEELTGNIFERAAKAVTGDNN